MTSISWSPQQNEALSKAAAWLRLRYAPTFYLAGYAGTGKSTLALHVAAQERGEVRFAAFTGKAARVMRSKGCRGAKTIHSMIYKAQTDAEGRTLRDENGNILLELDPDALSGVSLVIVDEVSMVNEDLAKDLLSYGVPVLVLGDPAQLPPVKGEGYFTSRNPDYMLTEVHRQAKDSPIIRVATEIREGQNRFAPVSVPGLHICRREDLERNLVTDADIVIVGRNDTRQRYNARLRQLKGFEDPNPMVGESLICLRNDRDKKISNGEIFRVVTKSRAVKHRGAKVLRYTLADPENPERPEIEVKVRPEFFRPDSSADVIDWKQLADTQRFTFGLAITAHKAQGSQWPNVCVFDESSAFREDRARWLYTAVTRAADNLTLVM
jgi:exodeoxyribonuclease-5